MLWRKKKKIANVGKKTKKNANKYIVLDENNQGDTNFSNIREEQENDSDSCISIDSKSNLEFLYAEII